jgi:hypothetical protein
VSKHVNRAARRAARVAARAPKAHHLDRRASAIAAAGAAGNDDDLLTTPEVADWFGVSEEWLEQARRGGYGPAFIKMSERVVRYTRGECRKFLKTRSFQSVAEAAR